MQKPEIPENDDRRVEALEALEILDTDVEEQLDFITKIVKERLHVPIVLISLVDKNRQWFKSKQGLSVSETSRDISFCGHAILDSEVFEISNAIEDSRFKDNPLVLGDPQIRFYAGAPITTVDGYRIGTLCIIDTKSRKLSQPEKEELESFAQLVESHLNKKELQPHLERILDNATEGLFEISMEGIFIFVNQFGANLLGYTSEELIGKKLDQIIPKRRHDDSTDASSKILEHISLNSVSIYQSVEELIKKDGELIQAACHLQPIFKLGKVSAILMSFVDNFEKESLKAEVLWQQAQSSSFKAIIDSINYAVLSTDLEGIITAWNYSAEKLYGYWAAEVVGQSISILLPADSKDDLLSLIARVEQGEVVSHYRTNRLTKAGEQIPVMISLAPIKDAEGRVVGISSVAYDMTEQLALEKSIQEMAFYDPLTKLANRRLLEDHIDKAFSVSRRAHQYGALLYLDLDNFKSLNDANGHEAGDLLLIEIARRLKSCVRELDTISRIGGDEFAVLISELEEDEAIAKKYALFIAEKIRLALAEPYKIVLQCQTGDSIVEHHCFASIGIAMFTGENKSHDELLKEADTAMYVAKHAGGNAVEFFNQTNDSLLRAENRTRRQG